MLVLSRLPGQGVVIRVNAPCVIRVRYVKLRGNKIRLGFDAPRSVVIDRDELDQRKREGVSDDVAVRDV